MSPAANDFVWDSMLSYWAHTGRLTPVQAAGWAGDETAFRHLGWDLSYGGQAMPFDPQHAPDAPWHVWVPFASVPDGAEHWATDLDRWEAAAWADLDPVAGWGAT